MGGRVGGVALGVALGSAVGVLVVELRCPNHDLVHRLHLLAAKSVANCYGCFGKQRGVRKKSHGHADF